MDLNISFPKVLILSRGFRAGDAITTMNLFSQWSRENLFCASPVESEYSRQVADFYFIGDKEVSYRFPFNCVSRPAKSHSGTSISNGEKSRKSIATRIYEKVVRPVLQWLDLYETRLKISLGPEIKAWINAISPQVIYTSIGDIPMAELILSLHKEYPNIKIICHCFDDWLSPAYPVIAGHSHRKRAEKKLKDILAIATLRLTSSEKMAQEYERRYRYKFICYPNPVKIKTTDALSSKNSPFNVVFTGKVGWHNSIALKNMIEVVEQLQCKGTEIVFDIYTDTSENVLKNLLGKTPSSLRVHKPVPNCQIPGILHSATLLYLPISVNKSTARFTCYSMSTKMGEYLSSGVPMIYVGPENIAMTEFLLEHGCAEVITTNDKELLKKTVQHSLFHSDEKRLLKAKQIANEYFDLDIVSRKFADEITNVCRQ